MHFQVHLRRKFSATWRMKWTRIISTSLMPMIISSILQGESVKKFAPMRNRLIKRIDLSISYWLSLIHFCLKRNKRWRAWRVTFSELKIILKFDLIAPLTSSSNVDSVEWFCFNNIQVLINIGLQGWMAFRCNRFQPLCHGRDKTNLSLPRPHKISFSETGIAGGVKETGTADS